jgi:hypothetical protein
LKSARTEIRASAGAKASRDRIANRYRPLIAQAAQAIVDIEAAAVRGFVKKVLGNRDEVDEVAEWLEQFYADIPDKAKEQLGPIFRAFADNLLEAFESEFDETLDVSEFVDNYIDTYGARHSSDGERQLLALLRGDIEDLEARVDEWVDTRADKIAESETVRLDSALYNAAAFSIGFTVFWRTRTGSCPLCNQLEGRQISSGQRFLQEGETVDPQDGKTAPLRSRTNISNPPLHRGCKCYTSVR